MTSTTIRAALIPTSWEEYEPSAIAEWVALLDADPVERKLQGFLERNPCFLPGGDHLLEMGSHHGSFKDAVYTQPIFKGMGRTKVPDFMWINRNSAEITPVCIEIERAGKYWFNTNRTLTAEFNQAHGQLADWRAWFRKSPNESIFRERYLSNEWHHRVLAPVYILAYGRHSEFERLNARHKDPEVLLALRVEHQQPMEKLMSLDSLRPSKHLSNAVTLKMTESGSELFALPRTFETGRQMAGLASEFRDPTAAIDAVDQWSQERKEYVHERWMHWQSVADTNNDMSYNPFIFGE